MERSSMNELQRAAGLFIARAKFAIYGHEVKRFFSAGLLGHVRVSNVVYS